MKKILIASIMSTVTTLIISGCSMATTGTEDVKTANYIHTEKEMTLKEFSKLIIKAGEEDGWRMTEFKDNALIAEKSEDGEMVAVTVSFLKDSFLLSPSNDDLEDAIKDMLEK
jgi:hypothetical protein